MKKLTIELPELVEVRNFAESINASRRTAVLEYTVDGKVISQEEANTILQNWMDYIKKLVPQTNFSKEMFVRYEEGAKKSAVSTKKSLEMHSVLLGKTLPDGIIQNAEQRIVEAEDSDGSYEFLLFNADWYITDSEGNDFSIAGLQFRFAQGQQEVSIYTYDSVSGSGDYPNIMHCLSWQKGVELYVEAGKKWLERFAPSMEIPLPA